MRVGIATVQVPFIHGGAELHVKSLARAIKQAGHDVEVITLPFRFSPREQLKRCMDVWETEDFEQVNGYNMDRVICMRFPAFYLHHPQKVAWLIHQHRAVYELWDTPFGDAELARTQQGLALREEIFARDRDSLLECKKTFTVSFAVSERLMRFNGVPSQPLYHPPPMADHLYSGRAESYILAPSRLETLKRLDLLIEAMRQVRSPVVALIAGDGGQRDALARKIVEHDLGGKVRMLGNIAETEMPTWYSQCLGVYFGPHQEDYGYITLEAMLAAKPVITCTDSGGPLEFVSDGQTGCIVDPDPEAVAAAIETLHQNRARAAEMGQAGLRRYCELGISWPNVVTALL